jgi:uncharacterized protein (DUF983 family)
MTPTDNAEARRVLPAMIRGSFCRCPNCGSGRLFNGFLRVVERCSGCETELHHHRADDAPPYFTMIIVGHLVIGSVLWAEIALSPPMWLHLVIWLPLTLILSLALLRPIKGIIVALQWALRMHGFGGTEAEYEDKAGSPLQ